jgi:hypothetical protein
VNISGISRLAGIVFGLAALVPLVPARAAIILETASYTGNDPGDYPVQGDGTNDNSRFIGARFSLSGETLITSVGVGLGSFGDGTMFAAIVPLAGPDANPSVDPASLASIALGSVVFAVPSNTSDVSAGLSLDLAAGDYAVVFGSGLFGADGVGPISSGNTTIGDPSLFQSLFSADWQAQSADGIRIVVEGTPVPEPASAALLIAGCALVGAVRRKRRHAA